MSEELLPKRVTIYSDGSCQNPRTKGGTKSPGACAAIISWDQSESVTKLGFGEFSTFVNRMELLGAIIGFRYLNWYHTSRSEHLREGYLPGNLEVDLITDSSYMARAALGLSKRAANRDLWKLFDRFGSKFKKLTVEHRPRNTHRWMEEADRVAGIVRHKILEEDPEIVSCVRSGDYFIVDL